MDTSRANGLFAVTGIITLCNAFMFCRSLRRRVSSGVTLLRCGNVLLLGLYGGIAIKASFEQRYDVQGPIDGLAPIVVSQGIHGIAGILWMVWSLVSLVILSRSLAVRTKAKKPAVTKFTYDWGDGKKRSTPLIVGVVDLCFITAVTVAVVYGAQDTPWRLDQCPSYEVYSSWPIQQYDQKKQCREMVTIQVLAVIVLILTFLQFLLLTPIMGPPPFIRGAMFLLARRLSPRRPQHSTLGKTEPQGEVPSENIASEKTSLESIFRNDVVVMSLAQYLHFDDINNVSRASKAMRRAVFLPMTDNVHDRRATIGRICCNGSDDKSECWACGQIVCKECAEPPVTVFFSRTTDHVTHCYAMCTKCYVKGNTCAAPLSATWDPHNLSIQHAHCSVRCRYADMLNRIERLCPSCRCLGKEGVLELREAREALSIRKRSTRCLRCRRCETPLPRDRKRWWICAAGNHECHWAGHEV